MGGCLSSQQESASPWPQEVASQPKAQLEAQQPKLEGHAEGTTATPPSILEAEETSKAATEFVSKDVEFEFSVPVNNGEGPHKHVELEACVVPGPSSTEQTIPAAPVFATPRHTPADSHHHQQPDLTVLKHLDPLKLERELGHLTYLGQGACGVVYLGLAGTSHVAVKFMICHTPQQLWQRAKEALLSKLVNHPCLVRTLSLDVAQVTDQTYLEWSQLTPKVTVALQHAQQQQLSQQQQQQQQPTESLSTQPDPTKWSSHASLTAPAQASDEVRYSSPDVTPGSSTHSAAQLPAASSSLRSVPVHAPVPFHDLLYHLDATPGKFMAEVKMEYCDCGTLVQAINRGDYRTCDPMDFDSSRRLRALVQTLLEIAGGMQHLHSLNIIHGDLKPGNVLLRSRTASECHAPRRLGTHTISFAEDDFGRGYQCKVSDFGLATTLDATEQAITSEHWGTVSYMAPEVMTGKHRKASDVYSFGVLLWVMMTGQQPYSGLQAGQVLLGVKTGSLTLEWPSWANKGLVKVGQACLRYSGRDRPGFKGVCDALIKIAAKIDSGSSRAASVVSFATTAVTASSYAKSTPYMGSAAAMHLAGMGGVSNGAGGLLHGVTGSVSASSVERPPSLPTIPCSQAVYASA